MLISDNRARVTTAKSEFSRNFLNKMFVCYSSMTEVLLSHAVEGVVEAFNFHPITTPITTILEAKSIVKISYPPIEIPLKIDYFW